MSARSEIRSFVRNLVTDEQEVSAPELVNRAIENFASNEEFVRQLFTEAFHDIVYAEVQAVIAETRIIRVPGYTFTQEELSKRVAKHSVFKNWLEHSGERHIRVMDMTKEDLLVAASERESRGERELKLANLWRSIAGELNNGEKVSTKFTSEDLDQLYAGAQLAEATT